jgi:hypothetical protein
MSDFNWSNAEKKVARQAFEAALRRELDSLMQEVRSRAAAIAEPAALWELEDYLAKRRRQIDGRYDYRYSVLPLVFAGLVRNGLLAEEELAGLAEDKREFILGVARMEMPSR